MLYRITIELDANEPLADELLREMIQSFREQNAPIFFMSVEKITDTVH